MSNLTTTNGTLDEVLLYANASDVIASVDLDCPRYTAFQTQVLENLSFYMEGVLQTTLAVFGEFIVVFMQKKSSTYIIAFMKYLAFRNSLFSRSSQQTFQRMRDYGPFLVHKRNPSELPYKTV